MNRQTTLECSCRTEIIVESADAAGLLTQLLRVILHLQGHPHDMLEPRPVMSTPHTEIFRDRRGNRTVTLIRK